VERGHEKEAHTLDGLYHGPVCHGTAECTSSHLLGGCIAEMIPQKSPLLAWRMLLPNEKLQDAYTGNMRRTFKHASTGKLAS